MASPKSKLTPIPKFKAERKAKKGAAATAANEADAPAAPDLSHITERLRPLALPLADLAFMPGNAMDHPEEQIEKLKASLRQFGQVEPLTANRVNGKTTVIGGNGRLQAMLALGWTHAAVNPLERGEQEAKAISVTLNESSEGRKWNAHLEQQLKDIQAAPLKLDPELTKSLERLKKEQKIGVQPIQNSGGAAGAATPGVKIVVCPKCQHEFSCEKKVE